MSDWLTDSAPTIAGSIAGGVGGLLGWIFGRRKRHAETLEAEAKAAGASAGAEAARVEVEGKASAIWADLAKGLVVEVDRLKERQGVLEATVADHEMLRRYVDGAWTYYDLGGTAPFTRPVAIVEIVRPHVADPDD